MKSDQLLNQHRIKAAEASGGTSSDYSYRMALNFMTDAKTKGALLEFGAGIGRFGRHLLQSGYEGSIVCADILPRPADYPEAISWVQTDLNLPLDVADGNFDALVAIEVIEHLENPRAVFREFYRLLKPGGVLIVTTPNQSGWRSLSGLVFGGHFALFLGANYPAHITALVEKDFERICAETGFGSPKFAYSGEGRIPKMTQLSWQQVSFGLLKGRRFSDNVGLFARRK